MSLPVFPSLPGLTFTSLKCPKFKTLDEESPNAYEVPLPQYRNPVWAWTLIFDFLHDYFWGEFDVVSELRTLMGFFNAQQGKGLPFLYTDPDDNYVGPALTSVPAPNTPLAQLALVSDGVGNYYSPVQRTLDGISYEDITDLNGAIAVYLNGTLATAGSGVNEYTVVGPGLAIPGYSWMGLVLQWGPGAPQWAAGASVALNYEIIDPSGHIQKVTTAGTTQTPGPPTWNDSGSTTTDGTAVWTDQGYYAGPAAPVTAEFNFYFRVRFASDSQDFEKFLGIGSTAGQPPSGQGGGYWTIGGSESQNGTGTLVLRTARPTPA